VNFGAAYLITLAGGVAAGDVEHINLVIDTEASAASDDLVSITGYQEGDMIVVSPYHAARTVVVKDNSALNLQGSDFTMDDLRDSLVLLNLGGNTWKELSRSAN